MAMVVRQGTESLADARVQCVGVLINCNTVLTTAKCAKSVTTGDQVRVGTPVGSNARGLVERTIAETISHPAFTTTKKSSQLDIHYNNAALFFLTEPVSDDVLYEEGRVGPVCQTDVTISKF